MTTLLRPPPFSPAVTWARPLLSVSPLHPGESGADANGVQQALLEAGSSSSPCFCGPCFGAGDVPANNALSVRHTTRNFPNREGSKPGDGQLSGVLLMDARSIAATARNHGVVTLRRRGGLSRPGPGAPHLRRRGLWPPGVLRLWQGPTGGPPSTTAPTLPSGPPSRRWERSCCMQVASVLRDPVTTTDELIPPARPPPTGPIPLKLASFALSRRDPDYVPRALATGSGAGGGSPRQARYPRSWDVQKVLSMAPTWAGCRSARCCLPTSPATARHGSRPPPASGCWGLRQPLL